MQIGRCCIYEHISIHALLAESDIEHLLVINDTSTFLSTLSLRRATTGDLFFYGKRERISIHALLAESDFGRAVWPGLSL